MSIQFSAKPLAFAVALIATGGLLSACGGGSTNGPRIQVSPANAYLLTSQNRIIGVDLDDTQFARSVIAIARNTLEPTATTGYSINALDKNEQILDIDYRNAEGLLYGLTRDGSKGRIVIIDPTNGSIFRRGTLAEANNTPIELTAPNYTIDFNPDANKLRIIGSDGSNLRVTITTNAEVLAATESNPVTPKATVEIDTKINPDPAPTIVGAAYTDERSSAKPTRLFGLDKLNTYALKANAGTVTTMRGLGVTGISDVNGYDISPANNQGVAIFTISGTPSVYAIDSKENGTSNAATLITSLPKLTIPETYTGLSLVTGANPTATPQ